MKHMKEVDKKNLDEKLQLKKSNWPQWQMWVKEWDWELEAMLRAVEIAIHKLSLRVLYLREILIFCEINKANKVIIQAN